MMDDTKSIYDAILITNLTCVNMQSCQ